MKNQSLEFYYLTAASIGCGLLLWLRVGYWQQHSLDLVDLNMHGLINNRGITFLFLAWNLFLAWIPYLLARLLPLLSKFKFPFVNGAIGLALVLWLLFFPNAPYIVTDLLHLKPRPLVPLWFDLMLLMSFAWTGLLLGIFSLLHLQKWVRQKTRKNYDTILAITLIPLCAVGVYVGRFLRWNSWEVFTQPQTLLSDLHFLIGERDEWNMAAGTITCFSLFLFLVYIPFKIIQKNEN